MSQSLGCVVFRNGDFFYYIHYHTVGCARPSLYDPEETERNWDSDDSEIDQNWDGDDADLEIGLYPDEESVLVILWSDELEQAKLYLEQYNKNSTNQDFELPDYIFFSLASRKERLITGPTNGNKYSFDWFELENEVQQVAHSYIGKKVQLQALDDHRFYNLKLFNVEIIPLNSDLEKELIWQIKLEWDYWQDGEKFTIERLINRVANLLTQEGVIVELFCNWPFSSHNPIKKEPPNYLEDTKKESLFDFSCKRL